MANSRLIVVLGMHRSGTSVVTRALQVMNVDLGDKLMPAAADNNPTGFFEDSDIHHLNVEMLRALHIDWFSLAPVEEHEVETLRKKGFFLRAVELLKSKCARVPVFAFKDPRVVKFFLFWKAVFDHCHFDVSYVVTVRHPRSVAKSLSKRDDFDLEKGYLLWMEHVLKIIAFTQTSRCVYVDYDKLILFPDPQLRRIASSLRLKVNAAKLKSFINGFLDRSLRHTEFTVDDLEADPACPPLAREIYGVLISFADASYIKSGRSNELQLGQWIAEFSRLKSTLSYVDRLDQEKSNTALRLFVPRKFIQVFFDTGSGFSQLESTRINIPGAAVPGEFVVDLPEGNCLLGLRVDPLEGYAVLRTCQILLVNEDDAIIDLMPFSRPDAEVSPEGLLLFRTQDPAIYFDLPKTVLHGAKRLKITLAFEAIGSDAERKYSDFCHAICVRGLEERLKETQNQKTQLERAWSESAGATERQLGQDKALLVTQHEQADKELREAHTIRERELQARLLASQDQLQELERGWNERAGATERQSAQERALLVAQHAQAGNELRDAYATREQQVQERLLVAQDQLQKMERDWSDRFQAKELLQSQQIALLNNQLYALQEKLYERLLEGQEQVQKLERDWAQSAVGQDRAHAQEREIVKSQLQAVQEKLQSGERDMAILAALKIQAEKDLVQTHAARESELHARLVAGQEQLLQLERSWIDRVEGQERLQAQDRALMNHQLQAMQEKIQSGELGNRQLLEKYVKSESYVAELVSAQVKAAATRRELIQQYNQSIFEQNLKLKKIRSTWFWHLLKFLNAVASIFNKEAPVVSLDDIKYVVEGDAQSNGSRAAGEIASPARDLAELIKRDGTSFIRGVYWTLLNRNPDQEGLTYYASRLQKSGDKLGLVYQVYSGVEARKLGKMIPGLVSAMHRERIKRLFKFRSVKKSDRNTPISTSQDCESNNVEGIGKLVEATATDAKNLTGTKVPTSTFEVTENKDPKSDPVSTGFSDGHEPGITRCHKATALGEPEIVFSIPKGRFKNISQYFMQPVESNFLNSDGYTFTRLMHYIWASRLDLQIAFDIELSEGRIEYAKWFLCTGLKEYGLPPEVCPSDFLDRLITFGGIVELAAISIKASHQKTIWNKKIATNFSSAYACKRGVNLIGYAFGEFGMGEHVRMVARSLASTDMQFCVLDQGVGVHGTGDLSILDRVITSPKFGINVFHVNADIFPLLNFQFDERMFSDRYNVGYWAWELSKCPSEFDLALNMVDEVWAISSFVAESFKTRAKTAVVTMPLAVTVPPLGSAYTKKYYGLPEDSFIFLFTFDAASYLDRKNPIATVRAFKLAFPAGDTTVQLVLKTMNTEVAGPMWAELMAEVHTDSRIIIITRRMERNDVLGMNLACDAFISLHRSEGFGRCVAEAMAYGKPVIVTNYSGTCEFANERTACLVDFKLVPVPKDKYPFAYEQVWAEPDIEHAAELMQLIAMNSKYRNEIAAAGQKYILENFNETIIGARYAERLDQITAARTLQQTGLQPNLSLIVPDTFAGCIDLPIAAAEFELEDSLSIEGWAISDEGIAKIDVYLDAVYVGRGHYGVIRNDISRAYPNAENAARSGFCYLLDTTGLAEGHHELKVLATSQLGNVSHWDRAFSLVPSTRYEAWLAATAASRLQKVGRTVGKNPNVFSLIVRTSATTGERQLAQTLASIKAQGLHKFEVILTADADQIEGFEHIFRRLGLDCRLIVADRKLENATSILTKCHGNLFSAVDAGSIFQPHAFAIAEGVLSKNRRVDFVYGDEDHILNGIRSQPIFKPGWSPVFLEGYNYIGCAWFARIDLIRQAILEHGCSMYSEYDHALVTRVGQLSREVAHVPSVFLSRDLQKKIAVSKSEVSSDAIRCRNVVPLPKVSIVIPTCLSDFGLVEKCFSGLTQLTDYPDLEILVVFNNVVNLELIELCRSKWPFIFLDWQRPFSWSAINNFGASRGSGEYLLFMNDDVESINRDWLEVMVQRLRLTGAGVVGSLLMYPNETVQHAGIYVNPLDENVRHFFRFSSGERRHEPWLMNYAREVSAVTGACLLTTKRCFDAVGGFDESLPLVCNDTDYCFRVGEMGYKIIIEPKSKLIHHEGVSRAGMPEDDDVARFKSKWKKFLKLGDPFSNPNLDTSKDDWSIDSNLKQKSAYRVFKTHLDITAK
jgi:GT2 family glycosyltransferase/glycosyltransferase involved in cell wall biosynthesis